MTWDDLPWYKGASHDLENRPQHQRHSSKSLNPSCITKLKCPGSILFKMFMSKVSTILCALMLSSITVGLPGPQPKNAELQTVYIDPEIHSIPAADMALINRTGGATGFYTASRKIVPVHLSGNVAVSFNTSTLQKRAGRREFTAYTGNNCFQGNFEYSSVDFGCGTFCATWTDPAFSMRLQQERTGNPVPTASLFNTGDCSGGYLSIGVSGTNSCTNSNRGGLHSAYLYFDC